MITLSKPYETNRYVENFKHRIEFKYDQKGRVWEYKGAKKMLDSIMCKETSGTCLDIEDWDRIQRVCNKAKQTR